MSQYFLSAGGGGGGGGIGGSTGSIDLALILADGTGGSTVTSATSWTIDGDQMLAPTGSSSLPAYSFSDGPTDGLCWFGQGDWALVADTVVTAELASNQIVYNVINRNTAGLAVQSVAVSANYAVLGTDIYLGVDTSTLAITITYDLSGSTFFGGQLFIIKDESGNALINNITVTTTNPSTYKIDGQNTAVINTNYGVLRLIVGSQGLFLI